MKFGQWKRLKNIAQKAAQVASKGARIGSKIIKYARPVIDTAADFIPGGAIIKKGTEYADKYLEPMANVIDNVIENVSKENNIVKGIKTGINQYTNKNPSEMLKRINNVIQYNIPEDIFGSPVNQEDEEDIGEF